VKIRKLIKVGAVLAVAIFAVGFFWLPGARERARAKATLMVLQAVASASHIYFTNCGVWPRTIGELTTTNNPRGAIFLLVCSPPLADAWGQPLTYTPFNETNGSVQSHTRKRDGREVVYEVRFGP